MKQFTKMRPAISAFLMMISLATISTALSFLNQPVSAQLQVGMGSFTLYYSLMVAAGAFSAPFVGQVIHKLGIPKILLLCAAWGCGCMWLFSFATSLWMFYATGIILGIFGSIAVNLVANVVLQTYYTTEEAASLIGIVMAGSGVGSMIYSALIPGILEKTGIAMTYRIIGILWLVILLLAWLVLGNARPAASGKGSSGGSSGMTRGEALKSPILYLMMGSVMVLTLGSGLVQHFPTVLYEQGHSTASAGAVISFYSAVLTAGKIAQGILYGKIGLKKGSAVIYGVYIAGFVLLLNASLSYPAFFCIGIGLGIITTLVPVLSKTLFGQKEYAAIYGIMSMAMSVGSFIATPAWGMIYDTLGSYRPGFMVMPVLLVIAFLLQLQALRLRTAMDQ